MANKLSLKDAEAARNAVMKSEKKKISVLYGKWANDVGKLASKYESKSTPSSPLYAAHLRELENELRKTSQQVSNEVYGGAVDSLYKIADGVVADSVKFCHEVMGFPEGAVAAAFSSVPDQVVRRIITGQVYSQGWSLSKAIWGENEKTLKDVHTIVAAGMAQNKPVFDIAKDLEQYVSPGKAKQWNKTLTFTSKTAKPGFTYNESKGFWEQQGRIYKKTVDYNAQRLVRTLSQHSYQQSLESVVRNNPFVTKFIWHAEGSRACKMCADLDGIAFDKGKLPLDHPNGMCTFEPVVDKDMIDKLAKWVTAEDGTYPEIDAFAQVFGFKPVPPMQSAQFLQQYGKAGIGSKAKTWKTWYDKLPADAQKAASTLKMESGDGWATWYANNVYTGEGIIGGSKGSTAAKKAEQAAKAKADFIAKHTKQGGGAGSDAKTWTTWFNKLADEEKAIATAMKEESGEGWATWYSKNVYTGDGIIGGSKGSSAAKKAEQAAKASKVDGMPNGTVTHEEFITTLKSKLDDPSYIDVWMDVAEELSLDHGNLAKNEFHDALKALAKKEGLYTGDAWSGYVKGEFKSADLDSILAKYYKVPKPSAQADAVVGAVSDAKSAVKVTHEEASKIVEKITANHDFATTDPLYSNIKNNLGSEALEEFKTLLHDFKNAKGTQYHIDAWKLYKDVGNADLDKFFVKHAGTVEQKQAMAAKKAAEDAKKAQEAAKKAQEAAAKKNAVLQDKIAKARQEAFEREKFVGGGASKTSPTIEEGPLWMEKLRERTDSVSDEWEKKAWETLESKFGKETKEDIRRAIENYSGSDYRPICRAYRDADNKHVPLIDVLQRGYEDDTKALAKLREVETSEPIVLRRGTGPSEFTSWHNGSYKEGMSTIDDIFEGVLGSMYDSSWRESSISKATDEQLDRIADALTQAFGGVTGKNASPLSTSQIAGRGFGGNGHPIEVVYYAPEGTKGMSIMKTSGFGHDEGEFLLAHDQRMKFIRAERITDYVSESKNCKIRVYVEILM